MSACRFKAHRLIDTNIYILKTHKHTCIQEMTLIARQVGKPQELSSLNMATVLITVFVGLPNNNDINVER